MNHNLRNFTLQLADNALILGHRISEWCGHGPALEQDIALANIALDHVGQSRMYYQHAAEIEGGKTEDDYAYRRDVLEFKNLLLLEHENVDFGYTIARSFFYDHFHYLLLKELTNVDYEPIAQIAAQAIKEVKYHKRYSSDWMRRLGDGTEESHAKTESAIETLWPYVEELFMADEVEIDFVNHKDLKENWLSLVTDVLSEATLELPDPIWPQKGGKQGLHTEHLGFILADMQFLQRAYPEAKAW